jgi:hypothetical protein
MKKFFFTILILLVLGGVAFFFGWAQLKVPPGQYGVIISKTHGIAPEPVRSGEFRWLWYKLLPTNVKISVFNLEHTKFSINYNSTLPSGNIYASFVGQPNTDFAWNLTGEIAFRINPDLLVPIAAAHNLTSQEDLNTYLKRIAKDIETIILRTLTSDSSFDDGTRLENIMSGNIDEQMIQEIYKMFPEIHDFSLSIKSAKFPNFILYRQLRLIYEDFLIRQRDYVTANFGRMAETHIQSQLRFDELERYGDLLTRYPILLEYMKLGLNNENQ